MPCNKKVIEGYVYKKVLLFLLFALVGGEVAATEQGRFFSSFKSWSTAFFGLFSSRARYFMLGRASAKGESVIRSQISAVRNLKSVSYLKESRPVVYMLSLWQADSRAVQLPTIGNQASKLEVDYKATEPQQPEVLDPIEQKLDNQPGVQEPVVQVRSESFKPFGHGVRDTAAKQSNGSVNNTMNKMDNQFKMFGWSPKVTYGVDPTEHARVKSQAEGGKYQRAQGRLEGVIGMVAFGGFMAWLLHKKDKKRDPETSSYRELSPYAFNQYSN